MIRRFDRIRTPDNPHAWAYFVWNSETNMLNSYTVLNTKCEESGICSPETLIKWLEDNPNFVRETDNDWTLDEGL